MPKFLRVSIYGGISECRCSEDKVGYGRCHHISGGENENIIKYDKDTKTNYVEVSDPNPVKNFNKNRNEVKKFISSVISNNNGFSETEVRKIIENIN